MKTPSSYFLITLIAFLFVQEGFTQVNLTGKIPVDPKVKIGKLPNGLTYYIRQNKKPENKVELRLVVNAGSILEDADQQGLAHFTEHMAFNGSRHFKKNELVSFLQSIGVQFGADLNASTSFDETIYILPIPLTDPNNLRKGFTVLQDWASGLSFDPDQIDGERGVVLEESRLGKGAEDRMFRKIYPIQYAGSKYAARLPIGKDSIVKNAKYEVVKRFYKQYYRPDLQAVIIVGDINVEETEKLVKEYFGALKNPATERPRIYEKVPERQQSAAIVATDKEATNFSVEVDYPITPSKVQVTVADYRESLVKELFTSLLNQRLHELTQSSRPPFLFAATGYNSLARGYEGFEAYAVAAKAGPDTALNALLTEVERAKKFGFTPGELDRGKKQMLAAFEQLYNNREKTESGNFVDEYIRSFLSKEPIPGIAKEYDYYKTLLPGIKLEEVNALANALKKNEHIFVSLEGPSTSAEKLPDNKALLAEAENALHANVNPYVEKTVAAELLKTKPTPGIIVSEKQTLKGVTEIVFANGVKAVLKPTDFKNDEIIMTSFHKGGTAKYGVEDKFNANYASTIVQQMGAGDFSPTDLHNYLAGKTVAAGPSLAALSAGISGHSSIRDFETLLQLTYLYMTSPRKDESLFNGWKDKQKSQMQFALADPQTAFVDTFYKVLFQNNPLGPIAVPRPEIFDQINLDRSLAIYSEQFGDANDFHFIFVGSFDIEKIKPLLATYLGSLPSQGKPASYVDNGLRRLKGDNQFVFKKGTEQKSLIIGVYSGEIGYTDDLALKADALKEVLNIKIIEDLREKLSAIYGGGIYGGLNKLPYNNYAYILQLPCGPENVDKLVKAAAEEIDSVKKFGINNSYLEKVKKTWIEQYKVQVKENSYWSARLQSIYFQNDDLQRIYDYERLVNAITTDDLKSTANLLFNGQNVLQAILEPEK